jgi:hypothetical protein
MIPKMGVSFIWRFLFVMSCGATTALAQYNAAVDVSKCYSNILQNRTIWEDSEDTHYHLMASMTREDYESLKSSGSLLAFIPGLAADASWEAARTQATKLVQTRDEELLRTRHTYSAVVKLDDKAEGIFRECVKGMVDNNPYGLFYYYTRTNDPGTVQLQLVWRWISGLSLAIKSSTIDNGYISGTSPKQRTLYAHTSFFDRYPRITEAQNFIVKFDDPNQDVNITLVSDPQIKYWPIVIPHLPLRKKCVTTWETAAQNPAMNVNREFVPEQHLTGKKRGGGDEFSYSEPVDGVIIDVTCNKYGQGWMELDLANGASIAPGYGAGTNQATCSGWQNATPRRVLMSYSWKKAHTDCEREEPWPLPK